MSTQSVMSGMYLSEDTEAALRAAQGEPCRSCQRFVVTQSAIVDDVLRSCSAAGNNDVLGRVLLRLAESGRCTEAEPFACLSQNDPRTLGALMRTMPFFAEVPIEPEIAELDLECHVGLECAKLLERASDLIEIAGDVREEVTAATVRQMNIFYFG